MSNPTPAPQFGVSVHPGVDRSDESIQLAQLADKLGLDLVTIMDHPFHRGHLDSWTLLTTLGALTDNIHLSLNVANLPLRPPAMLAKMVASLDILTDGRAELGLGAGGSWDGIHAFGGPQREPAQAYAAFKEALQIIRGLWDRAGESFSFEGDYYQVRGARFGPPPIGRIPIWAGAYGPSMQRLTGRLADGVIVSYSYARPEKWSAFNERLDEGAARAGREPDDVRRGYNMFGRIEEGASADGAEDDQIVATPQDWIELLSGWNEEYRVDTFILWPAGDDPARQIETFARKVVPGVRKAVAIPD